MSALTVDHILAAFQLFAGLLRIKSQDRLWVAVNAANAGEPSGLREIAASWHFVLADEMSAEEFGGRVKAWVKSSSQWPTVSEILELGRPDSRLIVEDLIRLARTVTPGGFLGEGGKTVSEREQWGALMRSKFGDPPPRHVLDIVRAAGGYRGLKGLPLGGENSFRFDQAVSRIEAAPRGGVRPLLEGEIPIGGLIEPKSRGGES